MPPNQWSRKIDENDRADGHPQMEVTFYRKGYFDKQ